MRAITCILCSLLIVGCAQEPPVQKVTVTGDSYCKIARPLTYSKRDSKPTVAGIRRHNAQYSKAC